MCTECGHLLKLIQWSEVDLGFYIYNSSQLRLTRLVHGEASMSAALQLWSYRNPLGDLVRIRGQTLSCLENLGLCVLSQSQGCGAQSSQDKSRAQPSNDRQSPAVRALSLIHI